MRERRERVNGPYRHRKKWRVVVISARSESERCVESFETETAAQAFIEKVRKQIAGRSVSAAVQEYELHRAEQVRAGEIKQVTADREAFHLKRILQLGVHGDRELRLLTPSYAVKMYEESRARGSVDTQRNGLTIARMAANWWVAQGWIAANPFTGIKGRGKRKHGKPQLRIDEARTLRDKCVVLAAIEDGAIVTLAYLLLGPRAGEMLNRRVRDLDNDGRLLWIEDTKTPAGNRTLEIPPELAGPLLRITHGRKPDDLIFEHAATRKRPADWAREQVWRLCKLAGVPRVTPHGLRGTHGSIAKAAGATSRLVADQLGHEHESITDLAYIDRRVADESQRRATLRVLNGGLS